MITVFILYIVSSGQIMGQYPSLKTCEAKLQYWDGTAACKAVTRGRERR